MRSSCQKDELSLLQMLSVVMSYTPEELHMWLTSYPYLPFEEQDLNL